jgi:hypothetical protein
VGAAIKQVLATTDLTREELHVSHQGTCMRMLPFFDA